MFENYFIVNHTLKEYIYVKSNKLHEIYEDTELFRELFTLLQSKWSKGEIEVINNVSAKYLKILSKYNSINDQIKYWNPEKNILFK